MMFRLRIQGRHRPFSCARALLSLILPLYRTPACDATPVPSYNLLMHPDEGIMHNKAQALRVEDVFSTPLSWLIALPLVVLCFLALVDGVASQLQLYLLGSLPVPEGLIKGALLAIVVAGCLLAPQDQPDGAPKYVSLFCVGYLLADIFYLNQARGMSVMMVLQSYAIYYSLLLVGLALTIFRGRLSQKSIIGCAVFLLVVSAVIGALQHFKAEAILYTESADGGFRVESWSFFDDVRAFGLFTSALNFGIYCALCGALGIALCRRHPIVGSLLLIISAVSSYFTLTRLSYLLFFCSCTYSAVLTFGKSPKRGLWQPAAYFAMGVATILVGLYSFADGKSTDLRDAASLLERVGVWAYYSNLLAHARLPDQMLGIGIAQNEKIIPAYPMLIDNLPLALILHIGVVGLVLFSILLVQMWLYLRREAIATQQPFMIAAVSLWASIACAGIFNIVLSQFGTVFALAVLCSREKQRAETAVR